MLTLKQEKEKKICHDFLNKAFGGEEYKKFFGHDCYFELWNNFDNGTFLVRFRPYISSLKEPFICVGETIDEVKEKAKKELKRQFKSDEKVSFEFAMCELVKFGDYFVMYRNIRLLCCALETSMVM